MKSKISVIGLLFLLTACGPYKAQAIAQVDSNSVCSVTHNDPSTTGLGYLVEGSDSFVSQVQCILNDDRSWAGIRPVKAGELADFRIIEVNAVEAKAYCGTEPTYTDIENAHVSCEVGSLIAINEWRFTLSFDWRILIVNHEVGHELGYDHDYGSPCSVMHDAGCPVHPGAPWPPVAQSRIKL